MANQLCLPRCKHRQLGQAIVRTKRVCLPHRPSAQLRSHRRYRISQLFFRFGSVLSWLSHTYCVFSGFSRWLATRACSCILVMSPWSGALKRSLLSLSCMVFCLLALGSTQWICCGAWAQLSILGYWSYLPKFGRDTRLCTMHSFASNFIDKPLTRLPMRF